MNIVILGGGTAGWLAALYAKKYIPHNTLTVIESKQIGILGAGEGTTPQFLDILENLDIPVELVLKHAKGTFKTGIKFTGWNKDNSSYFHPFTDTFDIHVRPYPVCKAILQNNNLDSYMLSSIAGDNYKVKYRYRADTNNINFNRKLGLSKFQALGTAALHFDARLLADLLSEIGRARGVQVIDNIVEDVVTDENGYITKLNFADGANIETDFIFDCSGFARLLVGKHYNAEWVSYLDSIPNDRALPFFIENNTTQIPPYTESIAMDNGWAWKIPVQGRFGCGYVYSSKYTTEEEVRLEIKNKFGEVNFPGRSFEFKAGCFKTQWVKNCMSLGLASGFIEPLEATSIWGVIESLRLLLINMPGLLNRNEHYIEEFNKNTFRFNSEIVSFIYYHYVTNKTNTKYWSEFRESNVPPAGYLEFENKYKNTFRVNPELIDSFHRFSKSSFISVGVGIDFFNRQAVEEQYNALLCTHRWENFEEDLQFKLKELNALVEQTIDHYYLIESIKNES